jgi:hypothetical protein
VGVDRVITFSNPRRWWSSNIGLGLRLERIWCDMHRTFLGRICQVFHKFILCGEDMILTTDSIWPSAAGQYHWAVVGAFIPSIKSVVLTILGTGPQRLEEGCGELGRMIC